MLLTVLFITAFKWEGKTTLLLFCPGDAMAAQLFCKQSVVGSNPIQGYMIKWIKGGAANGNSEKNN